MTQMISESHSAAQIATVQNVNSLNLPITFAAGLFSILPDTPWLAEAVANNGSDELRAVGFVELPNNPANVASLAVGDASEIQLTADEACTLDVFHCLREIDFVAGSPTWHCSSMSKWQVSGATGPADATLLGTLTLQANSPARLCGPAVVEALRSSVGRVLNIIVRRADSGPETFQISGQVELRSEPPASHNNGATQ